MSRVITEDRLLFYFLNPKVFVNIILNLNKALNTRITTILNK